MPPSRNACLYTRVLDDSEKKKKKNRIFKFFHFAVANGSSSSQSESDETLTIFFMNKQWIAAAAAGLRGSQN